MKPKLKMTIAGVVTLVGSVALFAGILFMVWSTGSFFWQRCEALGYPRDTPGNAQCSYSLSRGVNPGANPASSGRRLEEGVE